MRKKISPATILAVLAALTGFILFITVFFQNSALRAYFGGAIRSEILMINEITEEVSDAILAGDPAAMAAAAGKLQGAQTAGEINPDYDGLRTGTARAILAYSAGLSEGSASGLALETLKNDAESKNDLLRKVSSFILGRLHDDNSSKMGRAYYDAISATSRVHELISSYVESGGE